MAERIKKSAANYDIAEGIREFVSRAQTPPIQNNHNPAEEENITLSAVSEYTSKNPNISSCYESPETSEETLVGSVIHLNKQNTKADITKKDKELASEKHRFESCSSEWFKSSTSKTILQNKDTLQILPENKAESSDVTGYPSSFYTRNDTLQTLPENETETSDVTGYPSSFHTRDMSQSINSFSSVGFKSSTLKRKLQTVDTMETLPEDDTESTEITGYPSSCYSQNMSHGKWPESILSEENSQKSQKPKLNYMSSMISSGKSINKMSFKRSLISTTSKNRLSSYSYGTAWSRTSTIKRRLIKILRDGPIREQSSSSTSTTWSNASTIRQNFKSGNKLPQSNTENTNVMEYLRDQKVSKIDGKKSRRKKIKCFKRQMSNKSKRALEKNDNPTNSKHELQTSCDEVSGADFSVYSLQQTKLNLITFDNAPLRKGSMYDFFMRIISVFKPTETEIMVNDSEKQLNNVPLDKTPEEFSEHRIQKGFLNFFSTPIFTALETLTQIMPWPEYNEDNNSPPFVQGIKGNNSELWVSMAALKPTVATDNFPTPTSPTPAVTPGTLGTRPLPNTKESPKPYLYPVSNSRFLSYNDGIKSKGVNANLEPKEENKAIVNMLPLLSGMFTDGSRRADFVLVMRRNAEGGPIIEEIQLQFFNELIKLGIQIEVTRAVLRKNSYFHFVKLHATDKLLESYREIVNVRRFYTESHAQFTHIPPGAILWRLYVKLFKHPHELEWLKIVRNQYKEPLRMSTLDRSYILYSLLQHKTFGRPENYFGIHRLLQYNLVLDAYALHDGPAKAKKEQLHQLNCRQILNYNWFRGMDIIKDQPLHLIYEYFGSRVALYFALSGMLNKALVLASVWGLAMTTVYFLTDYLGYTRNYACNTKMRDVSSMFPNKTSTTTVAPQNTQKTGTNTTEMTPAYKIMAKSLMCAECEGEKTKKLCPYTLIQDYCTDLKLLRFFDSPYMIIHSFGIAVLTIMFWIWWRRKEENLLFLWEEERKSPPLTRPQFKRSSHPNFSAKVKAKVLEFWWYFFIDGLLPIIDASFHDILFIKEHRTYLYGDWHTYFHPEEPHYGKKNFSGS